MAMTNQPDLAKKMAQFRSHGISHNAADKEAHPEDEIWNYQQHLLGYNYRMTELQAALGLSQLKKLDQFVSHRRNIAAYYDEALKTLPIRTPWQHPDASSSFHLYPVQVDAAECGKSQQEVYQALTQAGIRVNLHYIPVYRHPYYQRKGFGMGYCPQAEHYFKTAISIPVYATMTLEQQLRVVNQLRSALQ